MEPISSEEGWLAATAKARKEAEEAAAVDLRESRPPLHPIPQLQGPFEESIVESCKGAQDDGLVDMDAQSHRNYLLESKEYERICGRKWRQKPGERYHPLWKLISQMSFGMHLLAKRLAKSELEVMKILQSHVDELDGFIERTTDDFLLAHGDVQQRLQYLKLPLENIKVFDEMLEDRSFRNSVIDENEKIEHVIERSAVALNDSFKDIQKGIDAVNMLWSYLKQLAKEWTPGPGRFDVVYAAMIGNVEGWNDALLKLQTKGSDLAVVLVQLGVAVSEIQRRVGMASRKDVVRISTPYQLMLLQRLNYPDADQKSVVLSPSTRPRAKSLRERFFERASVAAQNPGAPDKPLPSDPGPLDPAIERAFSTRIPAQRIARQSFPNLRHVESPGARPGAVPRRSRSFNDAANRASRNRSLPKIPETTAAGFKKKLPKTVSWTKPHPGDKLATGSRPATAPSRSLQARSRSLEQLETGVAEGKSSFKTVLDSLVQPEKKKPPLTPAAREKARDQLLHHFKSKRALDIVFLASKEQKPSRRTLAAKRDWPFSVFRAKSSKDPNRSVEASEFKNLGADQSPLSGSKSEHEMTWSHAEPDIPNTHTLKANPSGSPRLPMFPLCTPVKENFEDEKADQEEEAESELTALPSLGPSVVSKFDHAISQKPTAYICADSTLRVHESPLNSDAQSSPLDAIDTVDPDTGSLKTLEDKIPQNTEPLAVSSDSATSEMTRGCKSLPIDLASPPSVESQLSVPLRSSKRESETANQKSASCEKPKDLQNLAFLTSESLIEFLAATPPASPYPPADSPEISKQQENRSSRKIEAAEQDLGSELELDFIHIRKRSAVRLLPVLEAGLWSLLTMQLSLLLKAKNA